MSQPETMTNYQPGDDDRGSDRGDSQSHHGHLREMPSSRDAEQAVLGCCLQYPDEAMGRTIDHLGGSDDVFYYPHHQTIWAGMVGLWRTAGKFDTITLNQTIADSGEAERVGGPAAIGELMTNGATAPMLNQYLDIVKYKAIRRGLVGQLTKVASKGFSDDVSNDALIEESETALFALREFAADRSSKGMQPAADILPEVVESLKHAVENRGETTNGLSTGFPSLDLMFLGLKPATVTIIAARPAMGKTALMMNIVENMAIDGKVHAGVYSLEMSKPELLSRTLAGRAEVNIYRLRDGFVTKDSLSKLFGAAEKVKNAGSLFIDDTGSLTIADLRSRARRDKAKFGLQVIAIDYVQLLKSGSKQAAASRYVEVGDISRGLKAMAKELDIPIIVLAQLGRKVEERRDHRPKLSDLRESGDLEQDADNVLLLTRPGYYAEKEAADTQQAAAKDGYDAGFGNDSGEAPPDNSAIVIFAKQRNGPTGDIDLIFDKQSVTFKDPKEKMYDV